MQTQYRLVLASVKSNMTTIEEELEYKTIATHNLKHIEIRRKYQKKTIKILLKQRTGGRYLGKQSIVKQMISVARKNGGTRRNAWKQYIQSKEEKDIHEDINGWNPLKLKLL